MKKYIVGMLFGFFIAFSISANASNISTLIGKVIQGEFPVTVNGVKLDKNAVVVDGTSYLPVRAIGSATGYDITFDSDLGIILKKSGVTNKMSISNTTQTDSEKAKQEENAMNQKITDKNTENDRLSKLKANIIVQMNTKKTDIDKYQNLVDQNKNSDNELSKSIFYPNSDYVTWYKQFTDALTQAQSDLAVLQTQYDSIQSQLDTLNGVTPSPTP